VTDDAFDPVGHYDALGDREWERLERDLYHRLEFEETRHHLDEWLPEAGRLVDVGGGAGRYAVHLAERGYRVDLVDPSAGQAAVADDERTAHGVASRVTVTRGDARALPYDDDRFDATLCLGGPLSHVMTAEGRRAAAAELGRVTVPDGPVVVSVMGRLAALQSIARAAGRVPPGVDETELLPRLAETGDYDDALLAAFDREPAGPPMHLFRVAELETLLERAELRVETVSGLESIVSQRREAFDALTDDHRQALRETVARLRGDRAVADLSGHILAVARA
jgi:SAM-dependent methyltransferase